MHWAISLWGGVMTSNQSFVKGLFFAVTLAAAFAVGYLFKESKLEQTFELVAPKQ
jgi:hypothetical protein